MIFRLPTSNGGHDTDSQWSTSELSHKGPLYSNRVLPRSTESPPTNHPLLHGPGPLSSNSQTGNRKSDV